MLKIDAFRKLAFRSFYLNQKRVFGVAAIILMCTYLPLKAVATGKGIFLLASGIPLIILMLFAGFSIVTSLRILYIGKTISFSDKLEHSFPLEGKSFEAAAANIRLEVSKYLYEELIEDSQKIWIVCTPLTFFSFGEIIIVFLDANNSQASAVHISSQYLLPAALNTNDKNVLNVQRIFSAI